MRSRSDSVKRLRTWLGTLNPFTLNNIFNSDPIIMGLVSDENFHRRLSVG